MVRRFSLLTLFYFTLVVFFFSLYFTRSYSSFFPVPPLGESKERVSTQVLKIRSPLRLSRLNNEVGFKGTNSIRIETNPFILLTSPFLRIHAVTTNDLDFPLFIQDLKKNQRSASVLLDNKVKLDISFNGEGAQFNLTIPPVTPKIEDVSIPIKLSKGVSVENWSTKNGVSFFLPKDDEDQVIEYRLSSDSVQISVEKKRLLVKSREGTHRLDLRAVSATPTLESLTQKITRADSESPLLLEELTQQVTSLNEELRGRLATSFESEWSSERVIFYSQFFLNKGISLRDWQDNLPQSGLDWLGSPLAGDLRERGSEYETILKGEEIEWETNLAQRLQRYIPQQYPLLIESIQNSLVHQSFTEFYQNTPFNTLSSGALLALLDFQDTYQEDDLNELKDSFSDWVDANLLSAVTAGEGGDLSIFEPSQESGPVQTIFTAYLLSRLSQDSSKEKEYKELAIHILKTALKLDEEGSQERLEEFLLSNREGLYYWQSTLGYLGLGNFWPTRFITAPGIGTTSPPLLIYTIGENPTLQKEGSTYTLSFDFPVGETHYMMIRGVTGLSRLQLLNVDWRSDPGFAAYHSGYYYNSDQESIYLKITQRSSRERVILQLSY